MRNIILVLFIALVSTSCATLQKKTSTSVAVDTKVAQFPTIADLDVQSKVSKTVEWYWNPFEFMQISVKQRKENLKADIVKEANADVLLEPQVTYTKTPFGKREIEITGYPATFKNFRKATSEDLEALKAVSDSQEKQIVVVKKGIF